MPNRFKFNGQQLDPVTGQYYLRARFYNPVVARFTQEDVYRGDGLNLYAYCHNNPVIYSDPSGYNACSMDAQLAAQRAAGGQLALPAPDPQLALPSPNDISQRRLNSGEIYQDAGGRWREIATGQFVATPISALTPAPATPNANHGPTPLERQIAGQLSDTLNKTNTGPGTFNPDTAAMSDVARAYQGSQQYSVPWIDRPDGRASVVNFDGWDSTTAELIDRKLSVTGFDKAVDQVARQSEIAAQHGVSVRWEVPSSELTAASHLVAGTNIRVVAVPFALPMPTTSPTRSINTP